MNRSDHRRHARETVALAAVVSPNERESLAAVMDLSEGGARLEWEVRDDVTVGSSLRLCFLLDREQAIDVDAQVVRLDEGYAGVQFLPAQQDIVRQLLAEIRSDD
ncbi:PilZ domain-containing protein [Arenimonas sp.]|uniref:PilZ domain-containing protein n=1 Tax=Arenimonas sp. TaxID=1872635 RepID=UPI0039E4EC5A